MNAVLTTIFHYFQQLTKSSGRDSSLHKDTCDLKMLFSSLRVFGQVFLLTYKLLPIFNIL